MSTPLDFDFFLGNWAVSHRRLKHRLAGSNEWEEFKGTSSCRKILNGMGNIDENYLELPGGSYHAMTVRTFDPKNAEWSIWWFDDRYPGSLDPPVKGYFADGVGKFSRTTCSTAHRSKSASFGMPETTVLCAGNKPFPKTMEKAGKRTGSWFSARSTDTTDLRNLLLHSSSTY
jgi:hypothetical protein